MKDIQQRIAGQQEFRREVRAIYGRAFEQEAFLRRIRTRDGIEKLAREMKVKPRHEI